ncbi:MAG: cell division protein FtsA [Treponemataceae bacterium]|nr:MAG: cell division protein FtsA [Treponemataceae bacterium]
MHPNWIFVTELSRTVSFWSVFLSDIIVGLDVGTSFIRAIIGELSEQDADLEHPLPPILQISGVGKAVSTGLRKGGIVNIEATTRSITEAVEAAEMVSGCEVDSCLIAIGGAQVDGLNSKGLVAIPEKSNGTREVTRQDIERVIEAAKAVVIPMDRSILHVIPQTYVVDGQKDIKDPIDMICVRLEVETHIITSSITSMQNLQRCVNRAGYNLGGVTLKTLAAVQAVMTNEEMELGSILIDLGGGTTDVLVVMNGAPICTTSIPIGGSYVTSDIAIVKGISGESAEKIKLSSGCAWLGFLEEYEEVIIPGIGGRPPEAITRAELCNIIQPRMTEILTMVRKEVTRLSQVESLSGNIVLVGGGALMSGIVELTQEVFNTNSVRIGYPGAGAGMIHEEFRTPEYATGVGLILNAIQTRRHLETNYARAYNSRVPKRNGESFVVRAKEKFAGFINEFF